MKNVFKLLSSFKIKKKKNIFNITITTTPTTNSAEQQIFIADIVVIAVKL